MNRLATGKSSSKRVLGDLLLLLVAVIWGSAFVAQRVAAQSLGYFAFNGFRFLLGAIILTPVAFSGWKFNESINGDLKSLFRAQSVRLILVAGVILFMAAAFQQAGLTHTTAANAGFITSLYVILVPILAWVLFRQQARWLVWAASILAVIGAGLLSTGGRGFNLTNGDSLELVGAFLWALHLIVVGMAAVKMNVLRFSVGQFLVAGSLNITASLLFEGELFSGLESAWLSVVYVGIISTALGYTLQVSGQKYTPSSDAAILLSLESVFAGLFGWLLINETLDFVQIIGCGLILFSVILVQFNPVQNKNA